MLMSLLSLEAAAVGTNAVGAALAAFWRQQVKQFHPQAQAAGVCTQSPWGPAGLEALGATAQMVATPTGMRVALSAL